MHSSMHEDFIKDLAIGQEYENYIINYFWRKHKIRIIPNTNQSTNNCQENNLKMEIKLDRGLSSGNLYIEVVDKVDGSGGIWREGNKWLLIGDYKQLWIFDIEILRGLDKKKCYHYVNNPLSCSKAYLLPQADADAYCRYKYKEKTHAK